MSDLVNRLRGIYTVPVNDGAGLLDGKDTFTRVFPTPPISHEAAAEIERLTRELAEAREALRDTTDNGLIYWEPQTSRGIDARARMRSRNFAILARLEAEEPKP